MGKFAPVFILALVFILPLQAQSEADLTAISALEALFPIEPYRYITGRYDAANTADFVQLPNELTNGMPAHLRTGAADDLHAMITAAKRDGINLYVSSSTRSFSHQRRLWNARYNGTKVTAGKNLKMAYPDPEERILELTKYSAPPGISRHHWGTDVDLNSTSLAYWGSPRGERILAWLSKNAGNYGYVMVYTEHRTAGFSYEPWHWSYAPLARPILRDHFRNYVTLDKLTGFDGADIGTTLAGWEVYAFSVNDSLK